MNFLDVQDWPFHEVCRSPCLSYGLWAPFFQDSPLSPGDTLSPGIPFLISLGSPLSPVVFLIFSQVLNDKLDGNPDI
jgi:hypothetical protein